MSDVPSAGTMLSWTSPGLASQSLTRTSWRYTACWHHALLDLAWPCFTVSDTRLVSLRVVVATTRTRTRTRTHAHAQVTKTITKVVVKSSTVVDTSSNVVVEAAPRTQPWSPADSQDSPMRIGCPQCKIVLRLPRVPYENEPILCGGCQAILTLPYPIQHQPHSPYIGNIGGSTNGYGSGDKTKADGSGAKRDNKRKKTAAPPGTPGGEGGEGAARTPGVGISNSSGSPNAIPGQTQTPSGRPHNHVCTWEGCSMAYSKTSHLTAHLRRHRYTMCGCTCVRVRVRLRVRVRVRVRGCMRVYCVHCVTRRFARGGIFVAPVIPQSGCGF